MVLLSLPQPATFGLHSSVGSRTRRQIYYLVPRAADSNQRVPQFKGAESTAISPRLFCFGVGYTGRAICATLHRKGWDLCGTSRQPPHLTSDAQQMAVKTYDFDPTRLGSGLSVQGVLIGVVVGLRYEGDSEEGREALRTATHVLSTIAPDGNGADVVLELHGKDILEAASRALTWIGYISTTCGAHSTHSRVRIVGPIHFGYPAYNFCGHDPTVYGDWKGEWVDESSEVRPFDAKSLARVKAEDNWLSLSRESHAATHVFRCGGIYGPGRSVLDVVGNPKPTSSSQRRRGAQQYVSRCHVADICGVIEASIADPRNGEIYNVVDNLPASRQEVLAFATSLLEVKGGGSAVSNTHFQSDSKMKLGGSDDTNHRKLLREEHAIIDASLPEKRVQNFKIRKELRVNLKFPSYVEGLSAIASGSKYPFE